MIYPSKIYIFHWSLMCVLMWKAEILKTVSSVSLNTLAASNCWWQKTKNVLTCCLVCSSAAATWLLKTALDPVVSGHKCFYKRRETCQGIYIYIYMKEGRVCFCHFRQQSQKFKRKPKPNLNPPMAENRTHLAPQPPLSLLFQQEAVSCAAVALLQVLLLSITNMARKYRERQTGLENVSSSFHQKKVGRRTNSSKEQTNKQKTVTKINI